MPVIQMTSGLNIRTFQLPPANFAPLTAPDSLLLRNGFPSRPNSQSSPELRKRWERAFSQKPNYIVPTFREIEGITHRPILSSETAGADSSPNWSGSIVFVPDNSYSFQWIEGNCTIPNPDPSTSDGMWDFLAEWIDIDGDGTQSSDVLEAVTETAVLAAGGALQLNCYAWFEWYPFPTFMIGNFPVTPGDIMSCLSCANSPTTGSFYLTNN